MFRKILMLCVLIVMLVTVASTTAMAYGKTIITPNGYAVTDHCSFTRNGPICHCLATCDAYHVETGAYINHYSTAEIRKETYNGAIISTTGRQWINDNNHLTSSAETTAANAAIYVGVGWWGGIY